MQVKWLHRLPTVFINHWCLNVLLIFLFSVSMRRATSFPLISLLILLVGEIVCFLGHCNHKRKVLTFVAGILYVVGGKTIFIPYFLRF